MKDSRRDQTVAIPQSTLEELAESQRKLSKRDSTLVGGAIVTDDPRTPEASSSIVVRPPRGPIRRDELEAVVAEHLKLFPVACQEAFLRSFCARSYVAALALIDEAVKLQPKNLSLAQAASALRHFAMTRLEADLGGLHAKVCAVGALATSDLPRPLADMVAHIDGATSIEGLLRRAPGSRLQALGLLADLARDEQIELLLTSPQRNVSLRLPPMAAGVAARVDSAPKGGSSRDSGERKRVSPRAETPVPPPDDLSSQAGEEAKERRLVTWSSSSGAASVSGPFAAVERQPVELQSVELQSVKPAPLAEPAASPPVTSAPNPLSAQVSRPRQLSAAPRPVVSEARSGRPVPTGDNITSQRWFVPAVVAGVLALGGLLFVLFRGGDSVPPPPPARTNAASTVVTPSLPAPTLLPPVPVVKQTAEPSAAPAADGIGATMLFKIQVEPKYARVTLDGVLLTKAPIEVVIPKDGKEHVVRVESAGFHTRKMVFSADADVSMIVALDRAVSPSRASAPRP